VSERFDEVAAAASVEPNRIASDSHGDLRILRHAILHAKGKVRGEEHRRFKLLGQLVRQEAPIRLPTEIIQRIFTLVKQDCARLVFEWLGVSDIPAPLEDLKDFAIALPRRDKQGAP
jgi:hypothetical protein